MEKEREVSISRDWKERLSVSRDLGTGFAAPGGEFTRALYEWALTPDGTFLHRLLENRRVVELGAGMMPYGYALAATCEAKNFVAVEPFYADKQRASVKAMIEESHNTHSFESSINIRIRRKIVEAIVNEEASDAFEATQELIKLIKNERIRVKKVHSKYL